jgi:6-pyruvoyltetrahydropterin/6-carboxytetrahydropterin synthase
VRTAGVELLRSWLRSTARTKHPELAQGLDPLNSNPQTVYMPGQFEVMIERNFSSAHQLRGYRGKCENLHGHNYKIEIYARGNELNNIGLLVDFVELKETADQLVAYVDHKNLNELEPFVEEQNPSAENVARFFLEKLASKLNDDRVQIYKVRCFETPTSVATYQVD